MTTTPTTRGANTTATTAEYVIVATSTSRHDSQSASTSFPPRRETASWSTGARPSAPARRPGRWVAADSAVPSLPVAFLPYGHAPE